MKAITNFTTSIKKDEKSMLTFFEVIQLSINQPKQDGFSIDEIKKRIRVTSAIDIAINDPKQKLNIEDADFETLMDCWRQMKWGVIHKDIIKADEALRLASEGK